MSREPLVSDVERALLSLAKEATEWETITWLASVYECFDGGDFDIEDFSKLRWRLDVLRDKLPHTDFVFLLLACQRVLDSERTRERNGVKSCGNLARNESHVR